MAKLNLTQSGGGSGGAGGTVTSVAFQGDGTVLSSTPSAPVTTSGNVAATLNTQAANKVVAGPTSGAAANPTFRPIVQSDIPDFAAFMAYLPNVKVVPIQETFGIGSGPNYDIYTVPSGRRAIIGGINATLLGGNCANGLGNIQLNPMVKVSGSYYMMGAAAGVSGASTSAAAFGPQGGTYIAEAGEGFSLVSQPSISHLTSAVTTVAAATTTAFTLTSVIAPVNGYATYVGTVTGGGSNAFAGYMFVVTGFAASSGANNGTFLCVGSSTTTLLLVNLSAVAETHSGTATSQSYTTYTVPAGLGGTSNEYAGMQVTMSGLAASNNNGTFLCLGGTSTTLILANANGTAASAQTGAATLLAGFMVNAQVIEFDNTSPLRSSKILNPAAGLATLYTPSGSTNGALIADYFFGGYGQTSQFTSGLNENCIKWWNGGATEAVQAYYIKGSSVSSALTAASAAVGGLTMYTGTIPNGGANNVFALTATANASGGTTAYTGTITGGTNNAYAGFYFVIAGFANSANNGVFKCTASSTTTLTLNNGSGVSSSTQVAIATLQPLYGASVVISGFSNAGNNGTFSVVASTPTMLLVSNSGGLAESTAATVSIPSVACASTLVMANVAATTLVGGGLQSPINVSNGDSIQVLIGGSLSGAVYNGMMWCNVLEF